MLMIVRPNQGFRFTTRRLPTIVVASLFGLNTLAVVPVSAQTAAPTPATPPPGSTAQTNMPDDSKLTLQQRLEKRKSEQNIKLSAADQVRLKQRCKSAQGQITSLDARLKGALAARNQAYDEVVARLEKLAASLKDNGGDAGALTNAINDLRVRVEQFKTNGRNLELLMSDLAAMDCAADPLAFKSSLETARAQIVKIAKSTQDIHAFINNDVKPKLQQLRASLAAAS